MIVINYFTNSLLNFLTSVRSEKHLPEINGLEMSNDGTKILTLKMEDKFQSYHEPIPPFFIGSLYFMVLDSYIDSLFPEMEGTSFRNKYDHLPKNNNTEIMFSQLYRVLKLYRNATVHNTHGIIITKDFLKIKYNHKQNKYLFIITHKGIEVIEDMILCFFYYESTNYSSFYKEYLYYSFFDDILKEIKEYNDEYANILTINSKKINRIERFNCHSVEYNVFGDVIIFNIPDKLIKERNYAIDINIIFDEEKFIIPSEVIDNSKQMKIKELINFKLQ
jgi:hypothetical protein